MCCLYWENHITSQAAVNTTCFIVLLGKSIITQPPPPIFYQRMLRELGRTNDNNGTKKSGSTQLQWQCTNREDRWVSWCYRICPVSNHSANIISRLQRYYCWRVDTSKNCHIAIMANIFWRHGFGRFLVQDYARIQNDGCDVWWRPQCELILGHTIPSSSRWSHDPRLARHKLKDLMIESSWAFVLA